MNSYQQLCSIIAGFTDQKIQDGNEIFQEFISQLPEPIAKNLTITATDSDDQNRLFNYGCDYLVKYFSDDFNKNSNL